MRKFLIILLLPLFLVSCDTLKAITNPDNVEAAFAVQCRAYSAALTGAAAFKSRMSDKLVSVVDDIRHTVGPICVTVAERGVQGLETGAGDALKIIVPKVAELVNIEKEVQ